ncbi:MAG: hypothetical protein R2733_12495 [Acidimicrobiales bacterium]
MDELAAQPTCVLTLGTIAALILVVGELSGTLALAGVTAALFSLGSVRLLCQRRATQLQVASIGAIHLGVAILIAGTA